MSGVRSRSRQAFPIFGKYPRTLDPGGDVAAEAQKVLGGDGFVLQRRLLQQNLSCQGFTRVSRGDDLHVLHLPAIATAQSLRIMPSSSARM
jgi:hypothetical protein